MLSTANAGAVDRMGAKPSATARAARRMRDCETFFIAMVSLIWFLQSSGLSNGREAVGAAVLGEHARARERKMSAADHHLVGDDLVDQLSPGRDRHWTTLIVGALPFGMRSQQ